MKKKNQTTKFCTLELTFAFLLKSNFFKDVDIVVTLFIQMLYKRKEGKTNSVPVAIVATISKV